MIHMKDSRTLYDIDRPSLSKNQWRKRKLRYLNSGLKRNDWFNIKPEMLRLEMIRPGMIIQNKKHENKYLVLKHDQIRKGLRQGLKCLLVIDIIYSGMDWEDKKKYVKEIIDIKQFRIVMT